MNADDGGGSCSDGGGSCSVTAGSSARGGCGGARMLPFRSAWQRQKLLRHSMRRSEQDPQTLDDTHTHERHEEEEEEEEDVGVGVRVRVRVGVGGEEEDTRCIELETAAINTQLEGSNVKEGGGGGGGRKEVGGGGVTLFGEGGGQGRARWMALPSVVSWNMQCNMQAGVCHALGGDAEEERRASVHESTSSQEGRRAKRWSIYIYIYIYIKICDDVCYIHR
jgi:hypothetical protein